MDDVPDNALSDQGLSDQGFPDQGLPDFQAVALPDLQDLACLNGLIADVTYLFKLSQPDMHAA